MNKLMNAFAYTPALIFLTVGGLMNLTFAASLGTDPFTVRCWQALSVGATIYTALGCTLVLRAYRAQEYARLLAALTIMLLSLAYDVAAAYGFARGQHSAIETQVSDAQRTRAQLETKVASATRDLEPYKDASDPEALRSEIRALESEIASIDRLPGVLIKGVPCGAAPNGQTSASHCPRRADLQRRLTETRTNLARGEAKLRLQLALSLAQRELSSSPRSTTDPRTDLFGKDLIDWLPVALITLGAMLGFVAVTPSKPSSPAPVSPVPEQPAPEHPSPELPLSPVTDETDTEPPSEVVPALSTPPSLKRVRPGSGRLAERLSELTATDDLPEGIKRDAHGWLTGTQRNLAQATGYRHASVFNRLLQDALATDEVELEKRANCTAVRIKV